MADNDWVMVEGSEWVMVDRSDSESPSSVTMVNDAPTGAAERPVESRPEPLSPEFPPTLRCEVHDLHPTGAMVYRGTVKTRPEHLSEEFLRTIRGIGIKDYEIQAESADEFCSLLLGHVFKGWQSDKRVPGHDIYIQQEADIILLNLKAKHEREVGEFALRVGTWPRRCGEYLPSVYIPSCRLTRHTPRTWEQVRRLCLRPSRINRPKRF